VSTHANRLERLAAVSGAVAAAALALPGAVSLACTTLGSISLGVATASPGYQRDFRVVNNFQDAAANNNGTADPAWPGAVGAALAVWKGGHVWNSNDLGGRNFDFDWQGNAGGAGNGSNTVTGINPGGTCSGGVLAYCTPSSAGWEIKFCESWVWDDGPGCPGGGNFDIQGVGAHELGHSLGLGHTSGPCGNCTTHATMCSYICGNGCTQRSIEADDISCLGQIYGPIPPTKPFISGLSGSTKVGETLTIFGSQFDPADNWVKFTSNTSTDVPPIKGVVPNLPSVGGAQIQVSVPVDAQDGNVLVWIPSIPVLSNTFAIDVQPDDPPTLTGISPASVDAFGATTVTLTGTNLLSTEFVYVGSKTVSTGLGALTVISDTQVDFQAPGPDTLGPNPVSVSTYYGTSNALTLQYVETDPPTLAGTGFLFVGFPNVWNFGGPVGDAYLFVMSASSGTVPFAGQSILFPSIAIGSGLLDSIGSGVFILNVPFGIPAGISLFTQIWTIDPVTGLASFRASNVLENVTY
jgi:hypothetical protein